MGAKEPGDWELAFLHSLSLQVGRRDGMVPSRQCQLRIARYGEGCLFLRLTLLQDHFGRNRTSTIG